MSNDIEDLLDQVSDVAGWRVEKMDGSRWRVYPPKPHDIVHVSNSGDPHAIKNVKAQLKRAGFPFREDRVQRPTPVVGIVAQATNAVSPIERIKSDVDTMLGCLSRISDALGEIEQSDAAVQQLKKLLGTVLK